MQRILVFSEFFFSSCMVALTQLHQDPYSSRGVWLSGASAITNDRHTHSREVFNEEGLFS
jgi:hypothetical protein